MPLLKSAAHAAVSKNIREMVSAGHPQKQAVAAAMRMAAMALHKRKAGKPGKAP